MFVGKSFCHTLLNLINENRRKPILKLATDYIADWPKNEVRHPPILVTRFGRR